MCRAAGLGWEQSKGGMLEHGNISIRMHSERTLLEHWGRKITHYRFGLDVQIAKHLVGAPAAEEFDNVLVDLGTKESHSARGA